MITPALTETRLLPVIRAVRELAAGRSNATGSFDLAASPAVITTVTAPNCGEGTVPAISAANAAAAAELASGNCFVSAVRRAEFDVSHSASASTRSFRYALQG